MPLIGPGDLKDQTVHALWDLEEMKKLTLKDGATFDEVVQELQDTANEVSRAQLSIPHYGPLFSIQDSVEIEYPIGSTGGVVEATEYSVPDGQRGDTTGHNIPIKMWLRALGWTMLGLEDRQRTKIEADIRLVVENIQDHFQQRLLQRLFKMEAEAVGSTSGASVPLADGGTADASYVPMANPEGKKFLATHDHFLRQAATLTDALFFDAFEHLREHGYKAPFDVIVSGADAATWKGLDGWRKPTFDGVVLRDVSTGTDRAALRGVEDYSGIMETDTGVAYVWFTDRVPTGYWNIHKPYGNSDPRSPVRMRVNPRRGWGWQLMPGMYVNAPVQLAVLRSEFDFGIGEERTNGVNVYNFASGDYITPTIS